VFEINGKNNLYVIVVDSTQRREKAAEGGEYKFRFTQVRGASTVRDHETLPMITNEVTPRGNYAEDCWR
jgi:hypothetical protein